MKNPDYIIVGAGSAGCVLANRLTADPGASVLLLEAGGSDKRSAIALTMPAAMGIPFNSPRYAWKYYTEPEPYLDNRKLYYPRGKVLGGSSSINGMVFFRGHPMDYEGWAATGLPNWSYSHCLPYFKRLETADHGSDVYRGRNGPIAATLAPCEDVLNQAYLAAGQQAGYAFTDDVNGYRQEGFFRMEQSIRRGRRCSTAFAYLHPVASRSNLTVKTNVLITKVIVEGNRAKGVEFVAGAQTQQVYADREVILSAGAFGSPHILMLSGVGPADQLKQQGISVRHDLPGVGENLQEHLDFKFQYRCLRPVSLYRHTHGLGKIVAGLRWLATRAGPAATNTFESGAYFRSGFRDYPDLQHHFVPLAFTGQGSSVISGESYQVHLSQMRPKSKGWVRLKSADPKDQPRIQFNHLMEPADLHEIVEGLMLTREIMGQKAFDPLRGEELKPGNAVKTKSDFERFARHHLGPSHHPSCTCKMGTDLMAVVDGDGKVHGLDGLRIVDASVMPDVVSANINIPTIMLAEKLADSILGRAPMSAERIPFFLGESPGSNKEMFASTL